MLGRLDVLHAVAWFAATIGGWWGLIRMVRRAEAPFSQAPTYRVGLVVTMCTAALAWTLVAFLILGVHPLKQYNAHDFEAWDLWVRIWPYMILGIPLIGIGSLLTTPFRVRVSTPGLKTAFWLALLQTAVTWVSVFVNIPSA
jgi:hypothetical protein